MPIVESSTGLISQLSSAKQFDDQQIKAALAQARQENRHVVSVIVESGLISSRELADFCEQEYGIPLLDLEAFDLDDIPERFLKQKLIEKHHVLPIYSQGQTLYIAMSDPTNVAALEDFGFSFGMQAEALLVEETKLGDALGKLLSDDDNHLEMGAVSDADIAGLDIGDDDSEDKSDADDNTMGDDDAPIVVYINKLLVDAIRRGASDLHFEPYEKIYRVRFRIDGMLHEIAAPPVKLANRFAARLKVMARLDIAERRLPQDGRIKLKLSAKKAIDLRVNSLPTMWGEKIVMRILDSSAAALNIDILGYEDKQKQLYLDALKKPQGMILVTGPTGSGKTVSLYTGINILNTPEINISTAEDPCEITLPGVNQVQISEKSGLTFASALKAFLRQDPDVVMVGEIRDLGTAEIAIKAAQTGHLVLSTLHTNSAAETLTRLINMGVPAFNIASSVSLIIAQRLARRLCEHCKIPQEVSTQQLEALGFTEEQIAKDIKPNQAIGCDKCTEGYKGRTGIYEVMPVTDAIARCIMANGNAIEISDIATREGVNDLRRSGLEKLIQGIVDIKEIERVTSF